MMRKPGGLAIVTGECRPRLDRYATRARALVDKDDGTPVRGPYLVFTGSKADAFRREGDIDRLLG